MKTLLMCLAMAPLIAIAEPQSEKKPEFPVGLISGGTGTAALGSMIASDGFGTAKDLKKGSAPLNLYKYEKRISDGDIKDITKTLKKGDQLFIWSHKNPGEMNERQMISERVKMLEAKASQLKRMANEIYDEIIAKQDAGHLQNPMSSTSLSVRAHKGHADDLLLQARSIEEKITLLKTRAPVDVTELNKILKLKNISDEELQEKLQAALKAEINKGKDLVILGKFDPKHYAKTLRMGAAGTVISAIGIGTGAFGIAKMHSDISKSKSRLDNSDRGIKEKSELTSEVREVRSPALGVQK
jgi:hypothetical protein